MEVLIGTADIHRRIGELGKQIARDHPRGTPLLVGVLNGCIFFVADLMRAIPIPHEVDFVSVSSYGASSESSRAPRLVKDLEREIGGRDVILVEDIVDSGHTLSFLRDTLLDRFLVGYGLDFAERYRNLPYIAAIQPMELESDPVPEAAR